MTPKQQEVNVGAPVSNDDPLMIAWKAYQATENYANSKAWALHIAPMVQAGDPTAERKRRFEIMPFDQRERHVEGSLWAAFMEGWNAGRAALRWSDDGYRTWKGPRERSLGGLGAYTGRIQFNDLGGTE